MNSRKLVIALVLLAGIGAFFALDLGRFFSLAYIKESQGAIAALHAQRPLLVALVFFGVYVAITALSLPGAAIMTLAGGAVFGLVWGTVIVSFASTLGATLAMLAARYLFRDTLQQRFGNKLAEVDKGIARDGGVLPVHAAADSGHAVLRAQPADGPDAHEDLDLLLGQPGRHGSPARWSM